MLSQVTSGSPTTGAPASARSSSMAATDVTSTYFPRTTAARMRVMSSRQAVEQTIEFNTNIYLLRMEKTGELEEKSSDDFLPSYTDDALDADASPEHIETSRAEHAAAIKQLRESMTFFEALSCPEATVFDGRNRLQANITMLRAWHAAATAEMERLNGLLPTTEPHVGAAATSPPAHVVEAVVDRPPTPVPTPPPPASVAEVAATVASPVPSEDDEPAASTVAAPRIATPPPAPAPRVLSLVEFLALYRPSATAIYDDFIEHVSEGVDRSTIEHIQIKHRSIEGELLGAVQRRFPDVSAHHDEFRTFVASLRHPYKMAAIAFHTEFTRHWDNQGWFDYSTTAADESAAASSAAAFLRSCEQPEYMPGTRTLTPEGRAAWSYARQMTDVSGNESIRDLAAWL